MLVEWLVQVGVFMLQNMAVRLPEQNGVNGYGHSDAISYEAAAEAAESENDDDAEL